MPVILFKGPMSQRKLTRGKSVKLDMLETTSTDELWGTVLLIFKINLPRLVFCLKCSIIK